MGKTIKGKAKTAAKVAKAERKIVRKCKGKCAAVFAAFALAMLCGCATSDSQQPAKSATMNNEVRDSIIIVAAKAKIPAKGSTNAVIEVDGGTLPSLEILTLTQSLESSGTESYAQTATQTPTTDIKPKTDLRYNDAIGAGGAAAKTFVNSLTDAGKSLLMDYIINKKSGKITVEKKDGTTETLDCEGGMCTRSDGTKITAEDCESCKDCQVSASQ